MTHYGEWINSDIIYNMSESIGLLNKENYLEYLKLEEEFYSNFDYNSLFE